MMPWSTNPNSAKDWLLIESLDGAGPPAIRLPMTDANIQFVFQFVKPLKLSDGGPMFRITKTTREP